MYVNSNYSVSLTHVCFYHVHKDGELTVAGGNSHNIADVGFLFFVRDPFLICLGRWFYLGQI